MLSKLLDNILDLKREEILDIGDKTFVIDGYKPALIHYPSALGSATLTSVIDFAKAKIDSWKENQMYIHVEDHETVRLRTHMQGDFNQRIGLISAKAITTDFNFGEEYAVESFIIALNSQFDQTEDKDYLLKLISSLSLDVSDAVQDTGVSQKVATKTSITMKTEENIKNPLKLKPFRTFTEIEQPESEFIFRVKSWHGSFHCGLYPCDGAAWKLEAIKSIKQYFNGNFPEVPVIA